MNNNPYNPKNPSTWKTRYTMEDLQNKGGMLKIRIYLVVSVLIATSALYTISRTGIIYREARKNNPESFFANPLFVIAALLAILLINIIVLSYANQHANALTRKIYLPPDDQDVSKRIRNKLLIPRAKLPGFLNFLTKFPFIIIQAVNSVDENHWAHWFGGPALLIIYDGFAIYVERGNQFSRVLGAGLPPPVLERHERIKTVIDLRPQDEDGTVEAWTKDGIKVKADVKIKVKILASEKAKKRSVILNEEDGKTNLIYPFDPENIKKIVESTAVPRDTDTHELKENNWQAASIGTVTGGIKAYISGQSMSELITWDEESPQLLSFKVSDELFNDLKGNLAGGGKELLSLQITDFKPTNDEVTDKLIAFWTARKKRDKSIQQAEAEAQRIFQEQDTRTRAYASFFEELLNELESFFPEDNENSTQNFTEASLILLSTVLGKDIKDPLMGPLTAREILRTFEQLREQLNQNQG